MKPSVELLQQKLTSDRQQQKAISFYFKTKKRKFAK